MSDGFGSGVGVGDDGSPVVAVGPGVVGAVCRVGCPLGGAAAEDDGAVALLLALADGEPSSADGLGESDADAVAAEAAEAAEEDLVAPGRSGAVGPGAVSAGSVTPSEMSGAARGASPGASEPSSARLTPPAARARPAVARRIRLRLRRCALRERVRRRLCGRLGSAVSGTARVPSSVSYATVEPAWARTSSAGVPQPGQARAPLRCLWHRWQ
ncbi:hypothetical protein OFY01_09445 [Streptomyces sp. GXMU-J5]|uniref:Uncharacterized protein n=1 Tax=Streptomyces beihaiensis TaxID=2984495 RepID=A0ABT3TU66_9ACTN|nr:hypothetical protein [Streptomyces beihaiensis]MCX3059982.1 hypothetical protein [Streptomyces beihaiensis]